MMSGHGANRIFFNKKKIGRPEHSPFPTSPKSGRHMCVTPNETIFQNYLQNYSLLAFSNKLYHACFIGT